MPEYLQIPVKFNYCGIAYGILLYYAVIQYVHERQINQLQFPLVIVIQEATAQCDPAKLFSLIVGRDCPAQFGRYQSPDLVNHETIALIVEV